MPIPADATARLRALVADAETARRAWYAAEEALIVGAPDFAAKLEERRRLERASDLANVRVVAVLQVHLAEGWIVNAPPA